MRLVCGLVVVLMLVGCSDVGERVVVEYVLDGDTFDVIGGERVRIAGIDAPEVGEYGADVATAQLIDWIGGEEVVLVCDGVGKYGRRLCDVFVDGFDVGEGLVDLGLARRWR